MFEIIKKSFSDVNFNINLILHSLILFTFLTLFFAFFIAKISTQIFNDEISHLTENSLGDKINSIKDNTIVKNALGVLPIDKLIASYEKPDKAAAMNNKGLLNTVFFVNVLLWVGLIIVIVLLKYNCNSELHIKEILLENAAIFSVVGIIEYFFFTRIALKFVPVQPSFISKQFLESVKSEL